MPKFPANIAIVPRHECYQSQMAPEQVSTPAREQLNIEKSVLLEDMTKAEALKAWSLEAQAIMQNVQ